MKIYFFFLLFSLSSIVYSLNEGNIHKLIKYKSYWVNKKAIELSQLDLSKFPLIRDIIKIGYDPFINSVKQHIYNKIHINDHKEMAKKMFEESGIGSFSSTLLEQMMNKTLYASTFYGIFTDPKTKKAKFVSAIGQRSGIMNKESDWLVVEFQHEFKFYPGYSISFGHYGSQLELYNDRYTESHLDTKDFNKDASNLFYKFYFVLFFKYLDKIYGVKK